jgi:hypothetical protein
LRGGSIATLAKADKRHDLVEGEPWLEHDNGTRVSLPPAMTVIAPSRAASTVFGVPRATPAALRREVVGGGWRLGSVTEGDTIVVAGTAALAAAAEAGYRDDATVWTLAPVAGDVVAIFAARSTARAEPYHPATIAFGFAAVALMWLAALYGVGRAAVHAFGEQPERATATTIPSFGAVSIASAMPGSRTEVLETLAHGFSDRRFVHRGSMLPLEDELDDLLGDCWAARRQFDHVRLDDALASARACGDRDFEVGIQIFRGDYAAALALGSPRAVVREYAAIGAGDWKIAATAADAVAAEAKTMRAATSTMRTNRERCIAALFHAYAGDPDPFAKVADLRGQDGPAACRFAAAITQPPDGRDEALQRFIKDEATRENHDYDLLRLARQLHGPEADDGRLHFDIAFFIQGDAWLAAAGPGNDVAENREARVAIAVLRGDFVRAHAEVAALGALGRSDLTDVATVVLAVHEGTDPEVAYIHPAFEEVLALRRGTPSLLNAHGVYPEDCAPELGAGVSAALAGDGGPLARVFSECSVYYIFMPKLLYGILPHVKEHRAELADALRVFHDSITTFSFTNVPFRFVTQLADYRDTAHLAGDDDEANRMRSIIARHAHALDDPQRIIAFELVDN